MTDCPLWEIFINATRQSALVDCRFHNICLGIC
jgi:hypothetical protein